MLEYKTYRKLIRRFLDDERAVARLFQTRNIIPQNLMYSLFLNWAEDKTKIKYKVSSNMVCVNDKNNLVWMCQINMSQMSEDDIELIKRVCLKERKYEPATWSGNNERVLVQNLFDIIVTLK